VFRAYDSARERLVAVKVFKLDLPPERGHQLVAEFERLIAADLTHPGLAAPLATGISDVSAFLVQDYVAADSLDLAIREQGPAPTAHVLRVAAQLAGALDFAATVGFTHGALHPRDVLLSPDDTRLTGLGVTHALGRIGVAAPVRRPYTAPERLAGGAWDRRADVFSLAALMHELMWGRRVSGLGAQAAESLTEIAGANLPALRATFACALAERPAERYETAMEFAEAVRNACADVAVAPGPAAPAPKRRAVREAAPRLPLDDEVDVVHVEEAAQAVRPVETEMAESETNVAQGFSPADLSMATPGAVEEERYRDVEVAPAMVAPYDPPLAIPAGPVTGHDREPLSALERSRSAVWPLMLALVVGIAIGFAGGYGVGAREQPGTPPAAPAQAGREFTDGAVAEVPKPAPLTASPAPAPAPAPKAEVESPKSDFRAGVGRLLVRSRPAGARVYMDGKRVGTTPMSLASVPAGAHTFRLEHIGYRRWSSSVRIVAGEQHRVTASLER
jgi:hypothetical protein